MTERWSRSLSAAWLRRPGPADDKYRRGVLGVRTGSVAYPGAAVLGVSAAWRTGAGLIRYVPPVGEAPSPLGLPAPAAAVLAAHPETVFGEPGDGKGCDAWLIGSGTDPEQRSADERSALEGVLRGTAPVVVDAGGLGLAREVAAAGGADGAAPVILTPHRGEFARLWRDADLGDLPDGWPEREARDRTPPDEVLADAASRLAAKLGAAVLLKGSVSVAATPGGWCRLAGPATPWLATAGTGDVLAGILGAMVAAQGDVVREDPESLGPLGASAAVLHDTAARIASRDSSAADGAGPSAEGADPDPEPAARPDTAPPGSAGRPITALDVANAIPAAIAAL